MYVCTGRKEHRHTQSSAQCKCTCATLTHQPEFADRRVLYLYVDQQKAAGDNLAEEAMELDIDHHASVAFQEDADLMEDSDLPDGKRASYFLHA